MYNLSAICKAANELVKKGYSKSESFKKAWVFAKNVISKNSWGLVRGAELRNEDSVSNLNSEIRGLESLCGRNSYTQH